MGLIGAPGCVCFGAQASMLESCRLPLGGSSGKASLHDGFAKTFVPARFLRAFSTRVSMNPACGRHFRAPNKTHSQRRSWTTACCCQMVAARLSPELVDVL